MKKQHEQLTALTQTVIDARKASQEAYGRQAEALLAHPEHSDVILAKIHAKERKAELQEAETVLRMEAAQFTNITGDPLPYGLKTRKVREVRYTSHQEAFDWCLRYAPCFMEVASTRFNKAVLEGVIAPEVCEIIETVTGTIPAKLEIKE